MQEEEEAPKPEERNMFMQPPSKPAPVEPAAPSAQAGPVAAEGSGDRSADSGQAAAASSSGVTNWWSAPLPSVRLSARVVSVGVRGGGLRTSMLESSWRANMLFGPG